MDTFRDISAEEAKLLAIQFIGQQMGEIKDLNSRVINDSATLQRVNVDVNNIIKSIPKSEAPRSEQISAQPSQATSISYPMPAPVNIPASLDSSAIIERLDVIVAKLDTIVSALNKA